MRTFLTFIAVALVTALLVALVAPPFIDWSARRDMVARAISLRIGAPVTITGPVTLRLLPTPFLEAADVAIGPHEAPWLKGPSMRLELGLGGLFGGRIELDDVVLDHPEIHVGPRFSAQPENQRLAFEHVRIQHARLRVERADAPAVLIEDLSFDGSAPALAGPWRGGGDFALGGGRANYQIATDAFADNALPVRAEIDSGAMRADLDGSIALAGLPAFLGSATLVGETAAPDGARWPWRVAGELSAGPTAATMADAQLRLGPDAHALEASGRLALQFGDKPALDAELKAKTLNVDSLLRRDKELFATPARAGATLAALAGQALRRNSPLARFALKLQADTAYIGARTLDAPGLSLSGAPDGAMRLAISTGLPGRGRATLDGTLELGAAPIFRGHGEGDAGDFATLAAWIAEGQPELASRLAALDAALPAGDMSGAADLDLSPEGFAARGLTLKVAGSKFEGGVVYRLASESQPGRLYLDLASDALDIEAAPNVEAGLAWLGDTDLDFRLKADTLRVARVGLASLQGGSLVVRATKGSGKFSLQKLSLANLGGASIDAEGETSPSGRWARVKLDAGRLGDFAALLARAAPSPLTRWLQQRADELGAAKMVFEARRDGPPLAGSFSLDFLKADGEIAGARFGLTLSRAPAPVDAIAAQANLDAPDAGALLRRLGLKIPPGSPGRAELAISGTGKWEQGFQGSGRLKLAGADFGWSGALHPQAEGEAPWMGGPLTLKSADLFPALAALGFATTGAGVAAPADLAADLEAGATGARIEKLSGTLAGSRLGGRLAWAPVRPAATLDELVALAQNPDGAVQDTATVTGALEFDHATLGPLLSLTLGRPGPVRPGALWPEAKFGPALLSPPGADVALKIGALDLGLGTGRSASARLKIGGGQLALDDVTALLNGGQIAGKLSLGRDKARATASGALTWRGVGVDRPGWRARLDGSLEFAGAGESASALVGGLAGAGKLSVAEAKLPKLDPEGFGRAFAKIEQTDGPPPDEKRLAALIGAELDKGPLALANEAGTLALSSGALRFGPFEAPAQDGATTLSGAFDLSDLTLSVDATMTHTKVGPFWSGPPPSVEVKSSPDGAPVRKIETALLSAGLASEAIARESDRIANFEADLRERAMFNRKRKAELFLARREAEIAAFLDARERRRLMDYYFPPYKTWAESHRDTTPAPRADAPSGKNAVSTGLY